MNERFTYLVSKYLNKSLTETEKEEFAKFLVDPLCAEYLKKAEKAERIIDEGLQRRLAAAKKKMIPNKDDEALQKEIEEGEFYKEIEEDISRYSSHISEETQEAVKLIHQNIHVSRKRAGIFRYVGIAASIFFALVLFKAIYPKPTPQLLFEKYYETYEFVLLRSSINEDEIYSNAVDNYMVGNYGVSSKLCLKSMASQEPDPKVHFLYGLNLIQLDSLQSAIQQFKTAISFPIENNSNLYLSIYWYKSLCYLGISQPDSALLSLDILKGADMGLIPEFDVEGVIEGIKKVKVK